MLQMIDRLVGGEWSVDRFHDAFYDFYLEKVPHEQLRAEALEFFGGVQEKLDWTRKTPTEEERRYGWLDEDEFIEWVRTQRALLSSE